MKKEILFGILILILLVLTACTSTEFVEDAQHSEDWDAILQLMNAQCTALKHENLDELSALYAYPEKTVEYAELRKTAWKKFKEVNVLKCDFNIDKIEFRGRTAEVFMNLTLSERRDGNPVELSLLIPTEKGNDYTFKKINDVWKFCPNNDCRGTKTDKYVCYTGELADDRYGCPQILEGDLTIKPLANCFDSFDPERILRQNIGPYVLQEKSIKLLEDDPTVKINRLYQGDYMKSDAQKRLFNFAFIQTEDEASYLALQSEFKSDIDNIAKNLEKEKIVNLNMRDAQTIYVEVDQAPMEKKFLLIRTRYYIAIPEHNAFMKFYFNDWVNVEDTEPLVRTYLNSLCA